MSAKAVWGVIIIVLSVCLAIFSGFQIFEVINAESQANKITISLYQAMGKDFAAEMTNIKTNYSLLIIASIAGAIFGTKMLQTKTRN